MAANILSNQQRDRVIEMLAARESYVTIAKEVGCSWANIDYYAKRHKATITRAREERDQALADKGLRTREKRIEELEWLYDQHRDELVTNGLHYTEVKVTPQGQKIEYSVYNSGLIVQMRGLIKDLSEETSGRILRVAPTDPTGTQEYDGGSALNKLEGAITRLATRVATPEGAQEPDPDRSGSPAL